MWRLSWSLELQSNPAVAAGRAYDKEKRCCLMYDLTFNADNIK